MGKLESRKNGRPPIHDGFSEQVRVVTHARHIDARYSVGMGEIASISLVGADTRALNRIARKLERVLDPDSSLYPSSPAVRDRLLGSYLTIKGWSEILRLESKEEGKSPREASADDRNSVRIRQRTRDAFRASFDQTVEDMLSDKNSNGMLKAALLAAAAVASVDGVDLAVASARLQWLRHQAGKLSEGDSEYGVLRDMAEGILDIVTPVLKRTEVLFAA